MKVKTIGSFKSVTEKLEQKDKDFSNFLLKTALLINGKIQLRVQLKGEGSKGSKLKRYKKSYATQRKKLGYQAKFRDLTRKGNMWQSLTATQTGNKRVEMFFGGAEDKAKAFYNDQKTPFFNLNTKERNFLKRKVEAFAKL